MGSGTVLAACRGVLAHKRRLLQGIQGAGLHDAYSRICPLVESSIGGHVRHSLDHYQRCVDGIESSCIVDYDSRVRGGQVETNIDEAVKAIEECENKLGEIVVAPDAKMKCEFNVTGDSAKPTAQMDSTQMRELWFVAHHSIHHQAMIKLIVKHHPEKDILEALLPKDFGLAPSTISFLND
mmetsp:Transcript_18475/g.30095  ORF Transcript_18475/g.30095 Transcript_18475/m.30095 type:complete len:181 (+) Transcript_18475:104-646(+)|eukprot:CAMPEP_0203770502 /NCGR_PEP_ID=MMETSP0099_2-20121227/2856_1 /ASSEMBLY_ACC=CAM_ASM_000209 /TAXON_ID=96639 /ORGANISM=" , Strain NY0313808BC1" /LENGTH=180 /DNA_ID=CAMNT_0050667665 /DNA_START=44 /DNA_END=586 /DNA_ORIENTATION=-